MSKILYKQDTRYSCTCLHLAACFDFSSPSSSLAFHFFLFENTKNTSAIFSCHRSVFTAAHTGWHLSSPFPPPLRSSLPDLLFAQMNRSIINISARVFVIAILKRIVKNNLITIKKTGRWWAIKRLWYTLSTELKYIIILWVIANGYLSIFFDFLIALVIYLIISCEVLQILWFLNSLMFLFCI